MRGSGRCIRRCIRQCGGVGTHPIGDRLMHDAQMAGDPAQTEAVDIEPERLLTDCLRVALLLGLRGVLALAVRAEIALAPGRILTDFLLMAGLATVRTSRATDLFHATTLPATRPISHSLLRFNLTFSFMRAYTCWHLRKMSLWRATWPRQFFYAKSRSIRRISGQ